MYKNNPNRKRTLFIISLLSMVLLLLCSCQQKRQITLYYGPSEPTGVDALLAEGKYDEALAFYTDRLGEIPGNTYEAARISVSIADIYTSYIGDREKAVEYLEKAIVIDQRQGNELGLADCYYAMSNVYIELGGDAAEGVGYARQAEELYGESVGQDSIEVADSIDNIAMLYYGSGEWKKALESYQAAQAIYELQPDSTGYIGISIGKTYLKLEEYDKAEETFLKARRLCKEAGREYYSALANLYLGVTYSDKKEYGKAIDSYKLALDFFETTEKYLSNSATVYNNLASCILENGGKWEDGMPYAIKACRTIEKIDPLMEDDKADRDFYKQNLRTYYDKWKSDAGDSDFEEWYQKTVRDGEEWIK